MFYHLPQYDEGWAKAQAEIQLKQMEEIRQLREALKDIADRDIRDHNDHKAMASWCVQRAKYALEKK
jgi:hypothetical protein